MTTDRMENYLDNLWRIFAVVFITTILGASIWMHLKIIYALIMIPINYLWF